eukprot:gene35350-42839_t
MSGSPNRGREGIFGLGSEDSRGSLQMKRRLSGITFVISTALEDFNEEVTTQWQLDEDTTQRLDLLLDQFPKPPTQRIIPTVVPGRSNANASHSAGHGGGSDVHKTIWSQSLKGLTFGMFSNSSK